MLDNSKNWSELYDFVKKVRTDYRNPAAHNNKLTITSAKECLDYVIDVENMLKKMLIHMKKIINKKTVDNSTVF